VGIPSVQDVADAIGITLERQHASGAPWCSPKDGDGVRRWVVDRSAALGSNIRRLIRLVRVMAVADGRSYEQFLYERLTTLRAGQFRAALEAAAAQGRLPRTVATLSSEGIKMHEPAMAGRQGESFEIGFAQMPRLAALLDILHNALGFVVVSDILYGVCQQRQPPASATEVARTLHSEMNAWLAVRLESLNHKRQAQKMRGFLASRGRVAPEAVDNEAILAFWSTIGIGEGDDRVDGFRMYRSAASAMLRFRKALIDVQTARNLEGALTRVGPARDDAPDLELEQPRGDVVESWRSPLAGLLSPPADRVKWLTQKEQSQLSNFLGGAAGTAEQGDEHNEEEVQTAANVRGLFGQDRFQLSFWPTLMRADVFGAAQASIVARLRKRVPVGAAVEQSMTGLGPNAYDDAVEAYREVRQQLHLECLACLAALMEAGCTEAAVLINHLAGRSILESLVGTSSPQVDDPDSEDDLDEKQPERALTLRVRSAMKAAFADPGAIKSDQARLLINEIRTASRKVNRSGFRKEDRQDEACIQGLRHGALAAIDALSELDRLLQVLSGVSKELDLASDLARFHEGFRALYAHIAE
jgi:hypothetical protein